MISSFNGADHYNAFIKKQHQHEYQTFALVSVKFSYLFMRSATKVWNDLGFVFSSLIRDRNIDVQGAVGKSEQAPWRPDPRGRNPQQRQLAQVTNSHVIVVMSLCCFTIHHA